MENTFLQCEKCSELSKYPVGFWDGKDSGGCMWDCNNFNCTIKQENEARIANETAKKVEAQKKTSKTVWILLG